MSGDPGRPSALASWLDLLLVVGIGLLTIAPVIVLNDTGALGPAQIPLGFVFVFFLPGYAAVAAFYPSPTSEPSASETAGMRRRTDVSGPPALERLVLAVGLSIVAVPLVGLIWNFTPWGIAAPQVLGSLFAIVVLGSVVAAYRRAKRRTVNRFHLPLDRLTLGRSALDREASREATAPVAVTILVLLSVVAVSMAVAVPENGEAYTELYLERGDTGSAPLLTDDETPTLPPDEPREIHVGIGNRETRTITYTVVVVLQRIETIGDEGRVVEEAELDRFTATVGSGEQTQLARDILADEGVTGENLRLTFLLYKETPPAEPSVSNAYREVHIWVSVPPE